MNPLLAVFYRTPAVLSAPNASQLIRRSGLFKAVAAVAFYAIVLALAYAACTGASLAVLVVLAAALPLAYIHFLLWTALRPLSKDAGKCEEALERVESYSECAAYRDSVVAASRELTEYDLLRLRNIVFNIAENHRTRALAAKMELVKLAYGGTVPDSTVDATQRTYSRVVIGLGALSGTALFLGAVGAGGAVKASSDAQALLGLCFMLAAVVGIAALAFALYRRNQLDAVWSSPSQWDRAKELLANRSARPYLAKLLKDGVTLRVGHLNAAAKLCRAAKADHSACQKLHGLYPDLKR